MLALIPGCNSFKVEDSQPKLVSYPLLIWESLMTNNRKEGVKTKEHGKGETEKVFSGCLAVTNNMYIYVVHIIYTYYI